MDLSGKIRVPWAIIWERVICQPQEHIRKGNSCWSYNKSEMWVVKQTFFNEDTIETIPNKQPAEDTPTKDAKDHQLPKDLFTFELGQGASLLPYCRMESNEKVAKDDLFKHSIGTRLKSTEEKLDHLLEARTRERLIPLSCTDHKSGSPCSLAG